MYASNAPFHDFLGQSLVDDGYTSGPAFANAFPTLSASHTPSNNDPGYEAMWGECMVPEYMDIVEQPLEALATNTPLADGVSHASDPPMDMPGEPTDS